MRLFGTDACLDCKLAKMLFKGYNIPYDWVDVSTLEGFEGDIPQLILDNGSAIIGLGRIKKHLVKL